MNHKPNGAITTHISQTSNGSTVSVRPKTAEAFPALSSSEPMPQQPQWVMQKTKKQEPKVSKVAPAPVLPPSGLNDFPVLSKGGKTESSKGRKSSSVTVPVSNTWVNLNNFNSDAKNNSGASTSGFNDLSKQKQEKVKDNKNNLKNLKGGEAGTSDNTTEVKSKNKKKKNKNLSGIIDDLSNDTNKISVSEAKITENNERNITADEGSTTNKQRKVPNGITKKRSELNIGALEVNELPGTSTTSKPPPGFNVKPPPGFSSFIVPNSTLPNDLTFTSSSGQSYSIVPSQQFYPPPNFKSRNQLLIEKFKAVLRDSDAIQQFKVYSDMFRVGEIPPEKYYRHCRDFMGNEFGTIFPELLVLLPNVERQQDLYKVHQSNGGIKGLEICATCKQVILTSDLRNHLSNHVLDNHFPVLNNQVPPENNNVWSKK